MDIKFGNYPFRYIDLIRMWCTKSKIIGLFFCFSTIIIAQKSDALPIPSGEQFVISTDEGTDMNLDISPDGKTILFDLVGQIFTIPSKGGKACLLYTSPSPRD